MMIVDEHTHTFTVGEIESLSLLTRSDLRVLDLDEEHMETLLTALQPPPQQEESVDEEDGVGAAGEEEGKGEGESGDNPQSADGAAEAVAAKEE
jgi:hypothetical protein